MDIHRVKPGKKIKLAKIDPADTLGFKGDKAQAKKEIDKRVADLDKLQELLYAEHKHKVLVVLQGMDTSGKDGVIRKVFEGVNPQGVDVAAFKVPTPLEMDHDYLWRIHQRTPGKGEIVIFNRSHYEDVLVVRVHNIVPKEVWSKRYEQIAAWEKRWPMRARPSSSFSCTLAKMSKRRGCKRGWMTRPNTGSSAWATWPSESCGMTTWPPTRMPSTRPAPRPRRGMWCPPTKSGTRFGDLIGAGGYAQGVWHEIPGEQRRLEQGCGGVKGIQNSEF